MKTFWRLSVSAVCGAAIKDVQLETGLEACSFLQTEMKLKNQKPENSPECRVWQHTYVQNAACNHFGPGQAGGFLVTGARRSDTGFLATLLQGLGLDVSDAQQKERGKDGAVSWAHAFHGACEKEDLSKHGEKLFSKAYLLTRHPLDQITHAAAEDGDSWPSCGLDLGLSVFAQPTTWSDRLKLAMKHYVLLTSFVDRYAEKTFKLEELSNPKFDLGDLCRELGSSATSTVDCSNAELAKAVTGAQKSIAKDSPEHEAWVNLTGIDRAFAAMAQMVALRHHYEVSRYQLLPEAGWGFDCGFDPNGLWSCALTPGGQGLLSRDFNLQDLLRSRQLERTCGYDLTEAVNKSKVLAVSVARTGSESATQMMVLAGQPTFHNHQCSAKMLLDAGVGNVIVALRHPVARMVSADCWEGAHNPHYVFRMEHQVIPRSSNNSFLDMLKDKEHALHSQAMDIIYRPFNNGHFMPQTFYLDGIKKDDPRVNIVCTCTLGDDIAQVMKKLDIPFILPQAKDIRTHQSGAKSDDPKFQAEHLTQDNIDWLKKIYAEDIALYMEYCSRCNE